KPVVDGAAPRGPWFFVVSVTEMTEPAVAEAGAVSAETIRSDPTVMATERVLLASLVSATAASASAFATMKRNPAVPGGSVTGVDPASEAPDTSAGTGRPPRGTSSALHVLLLER